MSLENIVWALHQPVPPAAKIILIGLGNHARDQRTCFPSLGRLAFYSNCSEKTVQRRLEWLSARGYISVRLRPGRSSVYTLNIPEGALDALLTPVKMSGVTPDNSGQNVHTPRTTGVGGPRTTVVRGTNKKPIKGPIRTEGAEPLAASTPAPLRPEGDDSPEFIRFPLVGANGQEFTVTERMVAEFTGAYPGIDVRQELRQLRQWNLSNPAKRKTPRGIRAHLTGCLGGAQDKRGGRGGFGGATGPSCSKCGRALREVTVKSSGRTAFLHIEDDSPECWGANPRRGNYWRPDSYLAETGRELPAEYAEAFSEHFGGGAQ